MNIGNFEQALTELRQGRFVILVDDEGRENEGDLILAAEHVTSETINFMLQYGAGLICLPMVQTDAQRLQLPLQPRRHEHSSTPHFLTSIGAASGVSTGISASDRARTIQVAADPHSTPSDLVTPGHVLPLLAMNGGVFTRGGHTEGSIDLMRLAGLRPMAIISEVMLKDGTMARRTSLQEFAKQHNIPMISVADIMRYRIRKEQLLEEVATARLPVREHGVFTIKTYVSKIDGAQHVAVLKGKVHKEMLVRVHSACMTGDLLGSSRCDCGWQLENSLEKIARENGLLIYLNQEGRGIGLANKIRAYALQDQGLDTVQANHELGFSADQRDYGMAAQILRALGVEKVKLLTNNPNKLEGLSSYGIEVVNRIPLEMPPTADNITYLKTKRDKLGHLLILGKESTG